MTEEPVITLRLTVAQTNDVLEKLATFPFKEVAPLISEIQQQAQAQLKPKEKKG